MPTLRSSLAWGLVGGLSFLVLAQAFELTTGTRFDLVVKFGVAVVVTGATSAVAHLFAPGGVAGNGSP